MIRILNLPTTCKLVADNSSNTLHESLITKPNLQKIVYNLDENMCEAFF